MRVLNLKGMGLALLLIVTVNNVTMETPLNLAGPSICSGKIGSTETGNRNNEFCLGLTPNAWSPLFTLLTPKKKKNLLGTPSPASKQEAGSYPTSNFLHANALLVSD